MVSTVLMASTSITARGAVASPISLEATRMKISSAFQTFLAEAPDRAKAWIELARGGKR
jgi:hypothetical protein